MLDTDNPALVALVKHHAEAAGVDTDAAVAFASTSRQSVDADTVAGFVTELAASKPYLVQPERPAAPEPRSLTPEDGSRLRGTARVSRSAG
jgi:hypothetical protein